MLVYTCLPIYERYKDRYKMFTAMCAHGVRVRMILLHGEHPPASEMPGLFEELTIPPNTNIFTRRKYMREHLAAAAYSEPTIVHDTFVAQMGLNLRNRWTIRRNHSNVRNVLSLYTPNPGFFFGGHWLGKKGFRTTPREMPYHLRTSIPSIFGEILSCHLADAITSNTEEIAKGVQKYYMIPASRTHFVSAEIDTDYFCPGPARREELGLSQDERIILYAGAFERRKGIDVLLKAFNMLARNNHHVRLILLGEVEGTGYAWFKDLLDSLPGASQIEMRGLVNSDTLRDYYRSCDLFVTPTYHEGSPRVVKEAMACGLPVVTSRVSGNYAIDPQGKSLVYASDWDPSEYAGLMGKVLDDSQFRERRIEEGLKLVELLRPEAVARNYLELYSSLF